jgi:hypothetical protein
VGEYPDPPTRQLAISALAEANLPPLSINQPGRAMVLGFPSLRTARICFLTAWYRYTIGAKRNRNHALLPKRWSSARFFLRDDERSTVSAVELVHKSGFVSGHEFTRAEERRKIRGFNP